MRILKQATGVLGVLVIVIAIAALAMPKTAHAIIATAVQVVNTSANSVPTSDAGVALEPFEFEAVSSSTPVNSSSFTTPSTTADGRAVQRLVIEEVTVQCSGLSLPAAGVRVTGFPFSRAGANLGLDGVENNHYFPFPNNPASGQQVLAQPDANLRRSGGDRKYERWRIRSRDQWVLFLHGVRPLHSAIG